MQANRAVHLKFSLFCTKNANRAPENADCLPNGAENAAKPVLSKILHNSVIKTEICLTEREKYGMIYEKAGIHSAPTGQPANREGGFLMIYIQDAANLTKEELRTKGEQLEQVLQSAGHSEQEKQTELMEYLNLLNAQRAADVGVWFSERMLERVSSAFSAHPTVDLAVDQLYACMLLQQFHQMAFDPWRAHPAIESCVNAMLLLEAEGRWSDCLRYCQNTSDTYAEARFWPEALDYAIRAHRDVKQLLSQKVTVLENGELLDLRDSAFTICKYALHTAGGVTEELTAQLQEDLGAEAFAAVLLEAQDANDDIITDPVELTPEYLAIRYELEEKIDEALEHERGYYDYCKEYWMAKRLILRSDYGIHWKSPATLNPNSEFH